MDNNFFISHITPFTLQRYDLFLRKSTTIGKIPLRFREKPLRRCEKSRYFAPESRNKHVEQLKLYDYEEDYVYPDSSADDVSRS
jgi:hypothetical protein